MTHCLDGWDNQRVAALHKEIMEYPYDKNPKIASYVQAQIDVVLHYPLRIRFYDISVQYITCNLVEDRLKLFAEGIIAKHLERAFRVVKQSMPISASDIEDMAAALRGVEMVKAKSMSRCSFTEALDISFLELGTAFWGVVQKAFEDGRLRRNDLDAPEMVAQLGLNLSDLDFAFAAWRCRHTLRQLVPDTCDVLSWNSHRMLPIVKKELTQTTKSTLEQLSQTSEGRAMIADCVARISPCETSRVKEWLFLVQLVPMRILFATTVGNNCRRTEAKFPIQEFYLQCQRKPDQHGTRWKQDCGSVFVSCRMGFRYAIGVDKAILKHQIRLAKTPIHNLPYEVIQAVYGYIYGPHSFPSCFFSRFFTPTKGTCPDH